MNCCESCAPGNSCKKKKHWLVCQFWLLRKQQSKMPQPNQGELLSCVMKSSAGVMDQMHGSWCAGCLMAAWKQDQRYAWRPCFCSRAVVVQALLMHVLDVLLHLPNYEIYEYVHCTCMIISGHPFIATVIGLLLHVSARRSIRNQSCFILLYLDN